jgi:hypothetical protein
MQTEKIIFPELHEGETHLCALVNGDGSITHTILMKDAKENINWQDAMEWASSLGGDLPTRAELILLYENHKEKFKETWYWSNTLHDSASSCAWFHDFGSGNQTNWHEDYELRARAVRRLVI